MPLGHNQSFIAKYMLYKRHDYGETHCFLDSIYIPGVLCWQTINSGGYPGFLKGGGGGGGSPSL